MSIIRNYVNAVFWKSCFRFLLHVRMSGCVCERPFFHPPPTMTEHKVCRDKAVRLASVVLLLSVQKDKCSDVAAGLKSFQLLSQ